MLMGVISHCRVVVANDSGALHLAAALGVRAVGIYGPTDERYSTPVTPHEDPLNSVAPVSEEVFCRPCFLADCPIDHRCMKRIPTGACLRGGTPVSPGDARVTTHRAVFLDRDGTMIEDVGYLDRLERLKLFPYTIDAVRLLNAAGFKIVVVTSQNGVANGVLTEEFLGQAHAHLSELFEAGRSERWMVTTTVRTRRLRRWSATGPTANAGNRSPV